MGYHHPTSPLHSPSSRHAAAHLSTGRAHSRWNFSSSSRVTPGDLQAAVQPRVLDVLAQQILLSGTASSTNMELGRLGLQTVHHILQASGHTVLVGWETTFKVLGSVCRPTPSNPASYLVLPESSTSRRPPPPLKYLQEKGYSALIKFSFQCCCFFDSMIVRLGDRSPIVLWPSLRSFQCIALMCDGLAALSPDRLRLPFTPGIRAYHYDANFVVWACLNFAEFSPHTMGCYS